MSVLVLLATFNGERFLADQLESLQAQTYAPVEVLARDDGSHDRTTALLEAWSHRMALRWYAGEHVGASRSFWDLLRAAEPSDYYAFCDQDDVWDADKLEIALEALKKIEAHNPGRAALYCSDVRVVDADLCPIADHMVTGFPADYPHSLVKNIAPGCTFVFNHAARQALCRYDADAHGIALHDWTAFQIVACFGEVAFDPTPHLSYRQHGANAIGAVTDPHREIIRKARSFWSGSMRNGREQNAQRMEEALGSFMSPENRQVTGDFAHYRTQPERKRRLLRSQALRFPGKDGLLFRLLVFLNRL